MRARQLVTATGRSQTVLRQRLDVPDEIQKDKTVRGKAILHEAVDVLPISPYRLAEVLSQNALACVSCPPGSCCLKSEVCLT